MSENQYFCIYKAIEIESILECTRVCEDAHPFFLRVESVSLPECTSIDKTLSRGYETTTRRKRRRDDLDDLSTWLRLDMLTSMISYPRRNEGEVVDAEYEDISLRYILWKRMMKEEK